VIVGASRGAAIVFVAVVAAATASVIYSTGKRLIGRWAGVLAAVLFIASPLVQESSARVMTEHLSTLEMLVSTLCFARFARTEQIGNSLAFGTIAAVAILTHGNAWALGLVPGLTLALTNRWHLLRRLGFWLAAVPVLVICVPWYIFALNMLKGIWPGASYQAFPGFASYLYLSVGFPVFVFALIGVWAKIVRVKPRAEVAPEWAALAGLVVATFILYCVLPVGIESRYMVALGPSVVLFSTGGINAIAHRLGARLPIGVVRVGSAMALMAAFCVGSFALPLQLRSGGYEALVQDVMARVSNVPQVWLTSSGSTGEGCLVAAVALQEARPNSYALRAKKILAGGDWHWRNQQDRFDTPAKLVELLDDLPVTIIVIDDRIPPNQHRPYQDRLSVRILIV
jgi:4-amino-4-deoxy-L-arabinose transferase-like glycosyltransferase